MSRLARYILLASCLSLGAIGCSDDPPQEPNPVDAQPLAIDVGQTAPAEPKAMLEQLEALGYARGSRDAPGLDGVVVHRPGAFEGLNLYNSGHAPEAALMDMDGHVLHRWSSNFERSFPDHHRLRRTGKPTGKDVNMLYWRRVHAFENGDLLAIHEGLGIVKLDRDSNVLWSQPYPAHHDFEVMPNGEIYVLTRRPHMIPRIHPRLPVLEDFVLVLDADGAAKRNVSLLEIFEKTTTISWRDAWTVFQEKEKTRKLRTPPTDIFHTNSIRVMDRPIDGLCDESCPGQLLVSLRNLDTVALVDLDEERVLWAHQPFDLQHDPTITADDQMLIFNNHAETGKRSSVLILDPSSRAVVWEYSGTEESPLFSQSCGTSAELPNGNILVTETDGGRALEVTREKEIVWEFYNPNRAGDDDELIASLFEVIRLPPDFPGDWLTSPSPTE